MKTKLLIISFLAIIFLASCQKEPLPVASFSMAYSSLKAPATIQFINTSTNATYYEWEFNDGTLQSQDIEPEHVFSTPGSYSITLTAYNINNEKSTLTRTVMIE